VQAKDDEYPRQTDVGEFLDIYIPVTAAGKIAGAVEVHSVIGAVLLPMQRQVRELLYLLIVGTMLLIAVLFAVAQVVIVTPMRKVRGFVTAVESGDFDAKLDIRSKDEMGELSASLNRMAAGLRRLQELKNEFVFLASHELRAPVTVIKGYLALIEEDEIACLSKETRAYLVNIEKAGDRLGRLVDDLLEVARSEAGKLGVSVRPCDLSQVILGIIDEQKVLAEKKRISVAYDRPDSVPKVLADEDRLKEVLANLLSNAVKYSPEDTAIKVYHELRDGTVVTSVRDAGFGIPAKEQGYVFEKFFRSGTRKVRDMPGTGLGLFISKQLVEKMDGKIWFSSKEGGGTTFSFALKKA
jgi:signal transduction histidine kinase